MAAMRKVASMIRPGITTKELDAAAYDVITSMGAVPNFKGYGGFPGTMCASTNDIVVHGIPNDTPLKEGDILSVDMGAVLHGYHSDMARTFAIGEIAPEHKKLIEVTKSAFIWVWNRRRRATESAISARPYRIMRKVLATESCASW